MTATQGKRLCVYVDTTGHKTIGVGYNLDQGSARSDIASIGLSGCAPAFPAPRCSALPSVLRAQSVPADAAACCRQSTDQTTSRSPP